MNRRDVLDLLTRLQDALNVAHVAAPFGGASRPLSINPKLSSSSKSNGNDPTTCHVLSRPHSSTPADAVLLRSVGIRGDAFKFKAATES
jgi:hypothetical protein